MIMLKEFKEFAMRGNVLDMAIGIVLGTAFGKIVASFVGDVLMPLVSKLVGGVDFTSRFVDMSGGDYATLALAEEAGAAVLKYGNFLQTIIDFLIIAFAIFLVVKAINSSKKSEEAAAPTTKDCPRCLNAIPLEATRCGFCTSDV
ncbi:MAG: large-conductance mechanosensitive channel protein MscL [Gammaproteobacteria bacterium]|nr:large-conductance mechanosensitive channel protein MscL [Gammaproteobacteria bacterium]